MITSAEEFVRLQTSKDPDEYFRAAQDPAPEEVWLEVIEKYPHMKEWVAHNKTVKGKILELLSIDPDKVVRHEVATRRAAGEKILMQLASDSEVYVRDCVIDNPKITKSVLKIFLNDKEKYLRDQAAEKLANWKD